MEDQLTNLSVDDKVAPQQSGIDEAGANERQAEVTGFVSVQSLLQPRKKQNIDLQSLRERLAAGDGPRFWRTIEEAAETDELQSYVEQEFPGLSGQIPQGVNRRNLLKVMGASLAMAGAAACTKQPKELIVPYVRQPENVIPGLPLFYATAMSVNGYGRGLLVESHLNRPTKVEGNPDHPASLGSTGLFEQASVLDLYDPDRSQTVLHVGQLSNWPEFTGIFSSEAQGITARKGEGLAILSGLTTSPTLLNQVASLSSQLPGLKWYIHEPSVSPVIASAARAIAGRDSIAVYDFSKADIVVSLDSDFLNTGPGAMAYARQFSARRAVGTSNTRNRLYAVESTHTVSGTLADHRFPVKGADVANVAYHLAKACGVTTPEIAGSAPSWINAVAQDLQGAKGRCLIVPGEFQPESVHLAAHAMNAALGNIGQTVSFMESVEPKDTHSLADLNNDLNNGKVEVLLILGSNPVYTAPGSLNFANTIRKARLVVRVGQMYDETSRLSHWHIPEAHYLETWSDCRAFDGTTSIQQPLIAPLYGGKSWHEILTILQGKPDQSSHDIVKFYWQNHSNGADFNPFWQRSLHNGWVDGTKSAVLNIKPSIQLPPLPGATGNAQEVIFRPDSTIGDGTWSNNSWLQEIPKPQTKLTWDNVVQISPQDAQRMAVMAGDVLQVTVNGKSIKGPAWISPGTSIGTFPITFGYGRQASGKVGTGIGYDAYSIQQGETPYFVAGSVKKTGEKYKLADTQETQVMAGREPVRAADYAEYREHPDFPTNTEETKPLPPDLNMYKAWPYEGYRWGMSIDLNVCTGCSSCIIACQAENNIAVVGKDQVAHGRHMHWIRVDRYYHGNMDEPAIYNQPVPCMHCEEAPCEVVCPVAATIHSNEGLNEMVYNRCVGTRYCSNNCPYKVRRFNFLLYSDWQTQSMWGMRNPDVTVRSRGVMEKCSYCVQRIQEAKIQTDKEDRRIRDGEVITACQQVCPTQAITFGDLNDKSSRAAQLRESKRNYALLDDLNTRPRTTYLGYVRNANEALKGQNGNKES